MTEAARGPVPTVRGAIEIRRATVEDLATVVELRLALLREYADHPIYGRLRRDAEDRAKPVFERQIQSPDQAIFLAAHAGAMAGIARCADVRGSPLLIPDRYCYITSVYVRPEHRRHGVLTALMDEVEAWARERGLTEMRLHNSTMNASARSAWDKLGFDVNEEVRLRPIRR
ncbi:MAG TPA: GNAT family N-acetyltransferase [Gemmatimonadaceae bacterium]|nr:GNAT family N-acetyltransferase [Gemmatimonadaceae bacterium]